MNCPIRVLHVVGNMNAGGMETLVMNWYRQIDHSVVQFDFLVHSRKKGFYEDEIESLGGKVYHLSFLDDKNLFCYFVQLKHFFEIHPEYKIVHGHHSALGPIYLFMARKMGVETRISHSHIASFSRSIRGFVKFFVTRFFGLFSNYHFACSNAAGRYMFGKKDFVVINNGVNVEKFKYDSNHRTLIRDEFCLSNDQLLFVHVGRFYDQKNHVFLIDVFEEILKIRKNAKLLLVGVGPLKDFIEKKVRAKGLSENVVFAGNRNDVEKILSASDAFIFPSLYEGLPLTIVEAQCSGLRIVCSTQVTKETKLTSCCEFMSLNEPPQKWAFKILGMLDSPLNRYIFSDQIKESGYDSFDVVNKIQNFYLKHC